MSSNVVSTSPIRTVYGVWSPVPPRPANQCIDLEAQIVVGKYEPGPSAIAEPSPARPNDACFPSAIDPIDDFFAVNRVSRGTVDSRHHEIRIVMYQNDEIPPPPPPPYAEAIDLPSYASIDEPPTLAMYLFKFGFLFPLFWLAGICVLLCPLSPPENWEPTKTEPMHTELLGLLRRTEVKWARRCLIAFSVLILAVFALAVITFCAARST